MVIVPLAITHHLFLLFIAIFIYILYTNNFYFILLSFNLYNLENEEDWNGNSAPSYHSSPLLGIIAENSPRYNNNSPTSSGIELSPKNKSTRKSSKPDRPILNLDSLTSSSPDSPGIFSYSFPPLTHSPSFHTYTLFHPPSLTSTFRHTHTLSNYEIFLNH
jgi:hypothetical protein